jgi:putative (di)nucleoside polyphosphate hydrolase
MKKIPPLMEAFRPRSPSLPYRDGVGIVIVNESGLVLMGEANGHVNIWKMPQGGIEPRENPRNAALREVKEETGISVSRIKQKASKEYSYDYPEGGRYMPGFRGQKFQWFLVEVPDDVQLKNEDDEFKALRWVKPEEAIVLAHNASGDPVTRQRRDMYYQVLSEFNLLPKNFDYRPELTS